MSISKGFRYKDEKGKVTDYEYGVNGSNVTQDANHRLVTDEEKKKWNGKADPEDIPSGSAASYSVANNDTTTQAGFVADARIVKQHGDEIDQLSSEMAAITDSGAITGMDAREDGVYITYIPSTGADAVTKKLGSNPYLMGSEYTENWGFNVSTHNRMPSTIAEYISTNEPIDITYVRKITAKLGVVNNSNNIEYCGIGISKTQPTSFATAKANEIKEEFSSGMTGDISHLFELDVSGYSGEYYLFIYSNFSYETGIYFWKIE